MIHQSVRADFRAHQNELTHCARNWTQGELFAALAPHEIALVAGQQIRTFSQLNDNANALARALFSLGLRPGDGIAMVCSNRPEFAETFLAAMRAGLRLTPISTQLLPHEVGYVIDNSHAKLLITDGASPESPQIPIIAIEPNINGAHRFHELLQAGDRTAYARAEAGSIMLYTSGTTGKPKGVWRVGSDFTPPQYDGTFANYDPLNDAVLCCSPAYHAAPFLFDIRWPLASGVPIVMMEKWDAQTALDLIARHRVTHTHMVTTMFQRLLALSGTARAGADVRSLKFLVHGAAPCPVPVKQSMIDWFGPVLIEYYGATEGGHGVNVSSSDWLKKPGTVGRLHPELGHLILDERGQEVPSGTIGTVYFKAPDSGRFEYFGDSQKTASTYHGSHFTLGDLGYIDEDRYLFLTGRVADCIISGGVNISPQEVDDVLLTHPQVEDVCTVGVPDAEWGERVVSVVVARSGSSPNLSEQLVELCQSRLASFKRPREFVFVAELPRSATGKLLRSRVREYFQNPSKSNPP